jgi:hypothetical protein
MFAGEWMITRRKTDSQLFTLRVWQEAIGDGRFEIRGTLKHILSGETHHFRGWPALAQQVEMFFVDEKHKAPGGQS